MIFSGLFKKKKTEKKATVLTIEHIQETFDCGGGIVLYSEGSQQHYVGDGRMIILLKEKSGNYFIREDFWWAAGPGSSNGGYNDIQLDKDYFNMHGVNEFIDFLSSRLKGDFSKVSEIPAIKVLLKISN